MSALVSRASYTIPCCRASTVCCCAFKAPGICFRDEPRMQGKPWMQLLTMPHERSPRRATRFKIYARPQCSLTNWRGLWKCRERNCLKRRDPPIRTLQPFR